jgi:hypothetical protein
VSEAHLDTDWYRFFDSFISTARRLEVRDAYASPEVDAVLARVLRGEDDPDYGAKLADWTEEVIRPAVAAGKRFERVRVVRNPPTPYQRFGLRGARYNTAAGEDYRYLFSEQAAALRLPRYDFWLFDECDLVLLYFTDDNQLPGAYVVTAPGIVRQHSKWLNTAWDAAMPYADFIAAHPGSDRPPGGIGA